LARQSSPINFEEAVDDYLTAFKAKLLQKLHELSPGKFEEFAAVLLRGYGFQKVKVTGKAGDGGIDGHGELKAGLAQPVCLRSWTLQERFLYSELAPCL
jgi:restriction endonuclease Mrr